MTRRLEIPRPPTCALRAALDRGLTAVVAEGDTFYGLITRYDLLNHLRRTLS
jgi:cystathionine beta-synthase